MACLGVCFLLSVALLVQQIRVRKEYEMII